LGLLDLFSWEATLTLWKNSRSQESRFTVFQFTIVVCGVLRRTGWRRYLGSFGTRGLGYPVSELLDAIREVLGREHLQPVILVGVGNLGAALLRYDGFQKEGFEVIGAFDAVPEAVVLRGIKVPLHNVDQMPAFVAKHQVKLAVLAVPAEHAQEVANELVDAGVQGILSFSPTVLQVPDSVTVNSVDLALELEQVSFFLKKDMSKAASEGKLLSD
jgi:redox-sensing transcriptional repressor